MQTRIRIARDIGWRRFRLVALRHRQDFEQTVVLVALLAGRKHRTIGDFQRFCGRIWYAVARDYGFRRRYATGNKKTGWYSDVE
jgi:hypothetical protein